MDPIKIRGMHGAWTPTNEKRVSASTPVAADGHAAAGRKEAEAILQEMTEEFATMAYSLVHDFRAPSRAIVGFSQLLLRRCGDSIDWEGRDLLERMARAAQQQDNLIRGLIARCQRYAQRPEFNLSQTKAR